MTTRTDVMSWVETLRKLADRIEEAEHNEEVLEVADEAERVAAAIRSALSQ